MNKFALLCASAALLAAGNANALSPSSINPQAPGANALVIHYAGATAQSDTVTNLANDYCNTSTLDTYNNGSGPTAVVITCTLLNAAPVPSSIRGKNMYFAYYLDGGSIYGVTPVIDQIQLNYMKVFGSTCAETATGSRSWTCPNAAAGNRYPAAPIAGGSDVEPALFKGSNVDGLPFAAPVGSNYVADQAFNVVFAIALNCALLDHSVYTSCTTAASGPITSLSRTSIQSIFSGAKVYWEQVPEYGLVDNNLNGQPDIDDFYNGLIPGRPIHVCRRVAGSGTQASAQAYWLDQECSSDGPSRPFVKAATAAIPGEVVEVSSSTSILTSCAVGDPDAIAISSLEKKPGATYGTTWAYVAIDGILPTEENAATGKYDYMFENSMQYNTVSTSAEQAAFLTAMFSRAKQSSGLVGKPGVLAIPDYVVNFPGDDADADSDGNVFEFQTSNPVAWTVRDGLACKAPAAVYP